MGIHAKTGTPSEVVFTSPAHGKTIKFGLESPAYDLPYELPLSRFPQEMFDIIVSYLDQTDKLALLLTSKTLHARVRTSLYSSVKLRGKAGMKKFASTVAHSPIVCDYVRTCWLVGYVCCVDPEEPSIDFDLERLSMLREVRIQPAHAVTQRCSFMIPMLQKIVSGRMIQSLKSCTMTLPSTYSCAPLTNVNSPPRSSLCLRSRFTRGHTRAAFPNHPLHPLHPFPRAHRHLLPPTQSRRALLYLPFRHSASRSPSTPQVQIYRPPNPHTPLEYPPTPRALRPPPAPTHPPIPHPPPLATIRPWLAQPGNAPRQSPLTSDNHHPNPQPTHSHKQQQKHP
ncbi:hypothetical protein BJX76DRAFT_13777 [Aspergillus varians]